MNEARPAPPRTYRDLRPLLLLLGSEVGQRCLEPSLGSEMSAVLPGIRTVAMLLLARTNFARHGASLLRAVLLGALLVWAMPAEVSERAGTAPFSCAPGSRMPADENI
jgi:hypothetical protein